MIVIPIFTVSVIIAIFLWKVGEVPDTEGAVLNQGKVVAVDMGKLGDKELILNVEGHMGDARIKRDAIFRKIEEEEPEEFTLSEAEKLGSDISGVVRSINRGEVGVVELPLTLPDGGELTWSIPERGNEYLLILIFPIMILFYMYRSEIDAVKKEKELRGRNIEKALPGFNNKLILLMDSGLIYDDAMEKIAASGKDGLTEIVEDAIQKAGNTNEDAVSILSSYAAENRLSDLARLMSIIWDSKIRGTDLREKLSLEGKLLWEKRKRKAEEQGKLADTKLSLPLGMLMVALILVAAAPAFMQF